MIVTEALDGFIVPYKDEFLCVLVSPEDFAEVEHLGPWHIARHRHRQTDYAWAHTHQPDGSRANIYLHRYIAGRMGFALGPGRQVDHLSGDGLDCRRQNLRVVTHGQGAQNVYRHGGTSKYRGVSWYARLGKWAARVTTNGVTHHIGLYDTEEDAARAAAEGRARFFTHANETRHPIPEAGRNDE